MDFKIQAPFEPAGDQPQAIEQLAQGIEQGLRTQVLLGATGTGKTYTIAQVINKVRKPTLVIAHNKTLAAQLASELKAFFPENAVEYFVSYYDYYQPEAYIPQSDTYIEKDASINDEIDKLRHSATSALFERRDVIIVASVSCIYGLGAPQDYYDMVLSLRLGQIVDRQKILHKLVEIQYDRNDIDFKRGTFRVRGDVIEVIPVAYGEKAVRIELFDDEVDRIMEFDVLTGEILAQRNHVAIFPASHYVTSRENLERAMEDIKVELAERLEKEEVDFSDFAKKELTLICEAVNEILTITVDAFANDDNEAAKKIEPLEETIDDMVRILKDRHTKRLKNGTCAIPSGLVFMEALTHLERTSDHCSSIAVMMLARTNDAILHNHYEYLRMIHEGGDETYRQERSRRREQYITPLKNNK
mgnify:CR=1 FL=1